MVFGSVPIEINRPFIP